MTFPSREAELEDALRAVLMTHHRCKLSQPESQRVADRAKALVGPGGSRLYDEARKAAASLDPATPRYEECSREDAEMWCDRCKRRHGVVWAAPSDLWNLVMREGDRGKPDEFNFCCPICFMQLADERGGGNGMWDVRAWEPTPETTPPRLATDYELHEAAERVTDAARKGGEDPRHDGVFIDAVLNLHEMVRDTRAALVPPGPPAAPRWPGIEAMRG